MLRVFACLELYLSSISGGADGQVARLFGDCWMRVWGEQKLSPLYAPILSSFVSTCGVLHPALRFRLSASTRLGTRELCSRAPRQKEQEIFPALFVLR